MSSFHFDFHPRHRLQYQLCILSDHLQHLQAKAMSWLSEIASSHRLQLGVTAVASGFLAASAVIGLQEARKWYNERDLKDSIPDLSQPHDVEKVRNLAINVL